MKLFAALLLAIPAFAADLSLAQGESRTVQIFGVTAAWTIDPAVADAAVHNGSVLVSARAPGQTKLIVSGVTGEKAYDIVVAQRPGAQTAAPQRRGDRATAEVRYTSAAREVQNTVQVAREDAKRRTEASVRTIHQTAAPRGERARTSVAGAAYRVFTRGRELTVFDRDVDHSPLTLAATPLRGIHYLDENWRLHAGYTAYATYRSFLVPVERQFVAGGGYAIRTGTRSTLTPGFFAIRGEGNVASLLYDYAEGDRFLMRGEVGYSRGFGVAGLVDYNGDRDRVRASLRYRPDDFAAAGSATPRGFFGDASWTRTYGRGSTANASWSATDAAGARVMSASADVDHRIADDLSLSGGASWAAFDGRRTATIPVGVRADFGRYGLTALYRYTTAPDGDGGHGGRLGLRASFGRFHASAFADHQRNAPTLETIFSERPDLELALAELGISATSPTDIARALREHAILAELGFIDGVTLDLAPSRTQVGFEAAYMGTTAARHQLRLRVLRNVIESVAARRTSTIATISYARRIAPSADVFASWTYWRTDTADAGARTRPFAEVGIRRTFDGLPSLLGGTGTIEGIVFADENLDGQSDGAGIAAEVQLDGAKTQRTRADGTFAFTGVPRGTHRVTARVPDRPEAYFTTPARVEAEPGQRVEFGVAATPARLFGRVADDAGNGIAGVRVLLARGSKRLTGTTASDGAFAFASAPGEWELSLVVDSIPPGHDLRVEPRTLMLDRAAPAQASFVVRALRRDQDRASARLASARPAVPEDGVLKPALHIQIGAFRVHANAVAAAKRARAAGVTVTLHPSGALMLVRTAPIETPEAAQAVAARLHRAGLEAVVLSRN